MDKGEVLDAAQRFADALGGKGIRVERIILFGSYASGHYHEGSDIDLVVISQDFAQMDGWARIEVLSAAICQVWEPIEAIPMTPDEWEEGDSIIAEFAREGEVVFTGR